MLMYRRREVYKPPPPGREGAVLKALPVQEDLPPGPTVECAECGARLRTGTFHNAAKPQAHQALAGLVVVQRLDTED